jgi:hypothetical protein
MSSLRPALTLQPWYKEPWPWVLIALPASAVIASFVTLGYAIVSDDGMVDDDYYKLGKTINRELARDDAALRLGLKAQLMVGGAAPSSAQIQVILNAPAGFKSPDSLTLKLMHPGKAHADQLHVLKAEGTGLYRGTVLLNAGHDWHVRVEDPQTGWRLNGRWQAGQTTALMLSAKEH